ncbi:hypothetical protein BX600DRAFT_444037 [Xylariales sp. PMI_506]|nr:hypothetical protein BX600DRAFT_444037 [Xylariales sp. PMI_506]
MSSEDGFRRLEKGWNPWMIAAAMLVSFLGTFTATHLMIQARTSTKFTHVLTWILLVSLIFGFCSSWSLHFVGMLSCKLDVPIALDVGLTLFTGMLAVGFTFLSLGKDILRKSYVQSPQPEISRYLKVAAEDENAAAPLLAHDAIENGFSFDGNDGDDAVLSGPSSPLPTRVPAGKPCSDAVFANHLMMPAPEVDGGASIQQLSQVMLSDPSESGPGERPGSNSLHHWSFGSSKVDGLVGMATQGNKAHKNAFVATFEGLIAGYSLEAVLMGLLWSLSLTCMHYGGLLAMQIPEGYMTLSPTPVVISAIISWVVCIAGYIYMTNVEPFLSQQILFSVVAAIGIASMHFTGLSAATFYSRLPPSDVDTWPATLPIAVCSIAFLTCMLANGLLAHSAILSRNKLAEIVWTRRTLWRTMAEKELAEVTAAARSSFIASASHEIRTPLHHLQGYTDLLARSDLSPPDRQLLHGIQSAARTLSLITNNVLDWSKLESNMDTAARPNPLDMRAVFDSIVHILPSKEDDVDVDFMVVVAPSVPKDLLLDETYIHRIFMNLLSNALKFTTSGYVLVTMEYNGKELIAQVKDTGVGIPQAFLPRLFEPFSQAHNQGSQRGTGLGLSIIKQLLSKMGGKITVESHFAEEPNPDIHTGTTFTVTLPAQSQSHGHSVSESLIDTSTVAVFPRKHPINQEGQKAAWEHFGNQVLETECLADLVNCPRVRYIWADAEYLESNPDVLQSLLLQDTYPVLISYNNKEILRRLSGVMSAPCVVLLQKPLMWHAFEARIELSSRFSSDALNSSNNTSQINSLDVPDMEASLNNTTKKESTILLVEDNPINQKLAIKMLTSLGYLVLVASDGNEAISLLLSHDTIIDMVLMDQSMPNKDGVTATREIRQLEAEGKLHRKHSIIAVTAVVDSESMASFRTAGADEFLSKPLSMERLEHILITFLRVN